MLLKPASGNAAHTMPYTRGKQIYAGVRVLDALELRYDALITADILEDLSNYFKYVISIREFKLL
jgi:hypothetical protein